MPSPFPGMDPYIEGRRWATFHINMLTVVGNRLVPYLRPRYVIDSEERIYLNHDVEEGQLRHIRPDVQIADMRPGLARGSSAGTAIAEPYRITLPMPEEVRERYLAIRTREGDRLVTVIEILSPANKRAGSYDRTLHLAKRDELIVTGVNVVEIDLLRAGARLPAQEPLPPGDFYAITCRAFERPRAYAYAWTLRDPMPSISIPLADDDADVPLDLQAAFDDVYDHAGFDYSLRYECDPEPALNETDAEWSRALLAGRA
jgi:hypothetical protein